MKYGAIYVGPNLFGFTHDHGQLVLNEIVKDEFVFPVDKEIITIGSWPGGKHFYLKSNTQRVMDDKKFNSYEEARQEALFYVSDDSQIKRTDKFIYMHQGD